ncbi:hypothetical protein SCAR479_11879 [Seiridium cardinale]|uniref:Uncharacterized protein n=1 Tax=Seiridium cardinale TaxID=138064 RepID=A0ABR2XCH4_9PEZI
MCCFASATERRKSSSASPGAYLDRIPSSWIFPGGSAIAKSFTGHKNVIARGPPTRKGLQAKYTHEDLQRLEGSQPGQTSLNVPNSRCSLPRYLVAHWPPWSTRVRKHPTRKLPGLRQPRSRLTTNPSNIRSLSSTYNDTVSIVELLVVKATARRTRWQTKLI